jgi:methionyl-tRNA formyltransferase
MIITILSDSPKNWIYPYSKRLSEGLKDEGHEVYFVTKHQDVAPGDCAFLLGCEKLVKPEVLAKNKHNLVIHESALPLGKGWSPLTWQILEGKSDIPITLFEAAEAVDSGDIYYQNSMHFEGHELNEELKNRQGEETIKLVKEFVKNYDSIQGKPQTGEESFYERRGPKDSELDVNKSIADQFELLRVVDNERYPAFFNYRGHKYIFKIYKED